MGGGIELLIMEPPVIDEISHVEVMFVFEPDLPPDGESPVGVILVILIAIAIFSDHLPIFLLILQLFPDVSDPFEGFGVE